MKNEENDEKLVVNEEDKEVDASSGNLKLIKAIIYIGFIISIVLVIVGIVKYFIVELDSDSETEPETKPDVDPKENGIFQIYEKDGIISERENIVVYKCKKKNTSEIFAIKEIQMNSNIKKEDIDKEVKTMEKFNDNPNSLKFIEKKEENNKTYIVFESYDGDLKKYLNNSNNGFNVEEIQIVMNQLNKIVSEIRRKNMVHNDIKLENIFVKFNNTSKEFYIKLSEYGKAENISDDGKNDILSLGKAIYEMLSKNKVDSIEDIRNNIKSVTDNSDLQDLLNKTLVEKVDEIIDWDNYIKHAFFNNTEFDYSKVVNIVNK